MSVVPILYRRELQTFVTLIEMRRAMFISACLTMRQASAIEWVESAVKAAKSL